MGKLSNASPPRGRRRPGSKCSVGILVRSLDSDDADVLRAWMGDEALSANAIAEELQTCLDVRIPAVSAFQRHRRRDCVCSQDDPDIYG